MFKKIGFAIGLMLIFASSAWAGFERHANGVTITCYGTTQGQTGVVDGVTYTNRFKADITPENAATSCTSQVANMSGLFKNNTTFNADISHWDTAGVTTMEEMFEGATAFNQDISKWNTSNVTTTKRMFFGTVFNQDIGDWNTSKVTDFSGMFRDATAFNQDIGSWDTSSALYMNNTFDGASSFAQDLRCWDVQTNPQHASFELNSGMAALTDFLPQWGQAPVCGENKFSLHPNGVTILCPAAGVEDKGIVNGKGYTKVDRTTIDSNITAETFSQLENVCTSGITDMSNLFLGKSTFNTNISHWDTSSVTSMLSMFSGATAFNQDIGDWNTSSVTDMSNVFIFAEAFNQNIGRWNLSNVLHTSNMFANATEFNQDIGDWNVSNVETMNGMFNNATAFDQDISNWCVSKIASEPASFKTGAGFVDDVNKQPSWGFCGKVNNFSLHLNGVTILCPDAVAGEIGEVNGINYRKVTKADLVANKNNTDYIEKACTSGITDLKDLFYGLNTFNANVSHWDTSSVTDMSALFMNAPKFNQDIGDWNTSSVTNMRAMFYFAEEFNQDISNWDVSNVENMQGMFENAPEFNQDIGDWNVSNVTNMMAMFNNATLFNQDISNWCVSKIASEPVSFKTGAGFVNDVNKQPNWGSCGAPSDKFTCDGDYYISQGSTLFKLGTTTYPFAFNQIATGTSINALGFNYKDGYIYAMKGGTNELIKITSDGVMSNLGAIANMPKANYYVGDFDLDGNFYVTSGSKLYQIDVNTQVATVHTMSASFGAPDIAYNKRDGKMYGANNDKLYILDLNAKVSNKYKVTSKTIKNLPKNTYGSAWFDSAGRLFFSSNQTGDIYRVDDFTSPEAFYISKGQPTSSNDGTACSGSPILEHTIFPKTTTAGTRVTHTYTIDNGLISGDVKGDPLEVDFYDALESGMTFSNATFAITGAKDATYTLNAYDGNDTLDIKGIKLDPLSTLKIEVAVNIPADITSGIHYNQAQLKNLDSYLGGPNMLSDNPGGLRPDMTPLVVQSGLADNTIGGYSYNDLNKNGAYDIGELGIAGVKMILSNGTDTNTTYTDINGSYKFEALPDGTYTITQSDINNSTKTGGTSSITDISVSNGASSLSNNFYDLAYSSIGGYVFEDIDGNGYQDANETGISGVTVVIKNSNGNTVKTLTTSADGHYHSGYVLVPGVYTIIESDPNGYSSVTTNSAKINVRSATEEQVNFADIKNGFIKGVVFEDFNGDGVQNSSEDGVSGVIITIKDSSGDVVATLTTDELGRFSKDVSVGKYSVIQTQKSGYISSSSSTQNVNVATNGSAVVVFANQKEGEIGGIVYEDANGNGKMDRDEIGIEGVTISLGGATTTTQVDGRYVFENQIPGDYVVTITNPDGYGTKTNKYSLTLVSGGSASATFALIPLGSVMGVVFDDQNKNGIQDKNENGVSGAKITLSGSASKVAYSGSDGGYSFVDVGAGSYTISLTPPDGFIATTATSEDFTLSGGMFTAQFGAIATGSVGGIVFNDLNGDGNLSIGENGISGVRVVLSDSSSSTQETITNTDGSFNFTSVTVGNYTINRDVPAGFVSGADTKNITVSASSVPYVAYSLLATGDISGVVFNDINRNGIHDANESGVANVDLNLTNKDNVTITLQTGIDGVFIFSNQTAANSPFKISQVNLDGWYSSTDNNYTFTLPAGEAKNYSFGSYKNSAPVDITISNNSVAENNSIGSVIGELDVTDSDIIDSHTFAFCSGDDSNFTLDGTTLKSAIVFDYENETSYTTCIKVTESNQASYEKNLTINITNIDESVAGTCGTSHGQTFTVAPTENLCSVGSASNVTSDTDNFYWYCTGSSYELNTNCSATYQNNSSNDDTQEPTAHEFEDNEDGTKTLTVGEDEDTITITLPQDKEVVVTENEENTTLSSDNPQVDITINDDGSITTNQIFEDGDANNTVEIDIPNSDIKIQEDNSVVIQSNTKNDNNEDVNITTTLREDGSIIIASKVAENNATVISIDEPGSTIKIDEKGNITIDGEKELVEDSKIVALHLVIDANSGAIDGSLIHKDSTTQEIVETQEIHKVVGTVLKVTNFKIQEVLATLDDNRKVEVTVSDESNTTLKSTTIIDNSVADENITRLSNGETGAVTTQVTNSTSTITIDNYLDGKAKHSVKVGTTITEASSNLEGADVNVTSSGVTTTFENNTTKAQVTASNDGIATHKMTIGGKTTEATSQIIGAKTVIDSDANGDPKIVTKVSTTNSNSQVVEIEVDALSDGSAKHTVKVGGKESIATSKLQGANTTIKTSGEVETIAPTTKTKDGDEWIFEAVAKTDAYGKTVTTFQLRNKTTNEVKEPQNTFVPNTPYDAGNKVEIIEQNNIIYFKTQSPVTAPLTVE